MEGKEVIERFCALQELVVCEYLGYEHSADCFCGKGGFWKSPYYDGTFKGGYRNDGLALEFIEQAVKEKLLSIQNPELLD